LIPSRDDRVTDHLDEVALGPPRTSAKLSTRAPARPASPVYRARARFALARALWEEGTKRTGAVALAAAARLDYQQSPSTPATKRDLASVDAWIAGHS